ncbi:SDR family NAD(P)-dependent oxidoreductase [Burkholderia gladioli]|uniref:SDR family NAD(P)-dependent oxidoreductase n=2 Tax=Burkholderia gladioli TaxID=28095 RepID=UPI003132FBC0
MMSVADSVPHGMAADHAGNTLRGLLRGKTALITGAGQGNGRALALGFAHAGARVIATDVREATACETAQAINDAGGEAWGYELDVADERACRAAAAEFRKFAGPIDILVNNAGIVIREGMDSPHAVENWHRVLGVNLDGSFHMILAFRDDLRTTRGAIINVGSIASFIGVDSALGYSASKGGVRLLTQAMARDLATDGIRVNAIAPGLIETAMTESTRNNQDRLNGMMARTPMRRAGQPEELVGPCLFLASSMAAYVTGVTLPVDGGFLAS